MEGRGPGETSYRLAGLTGHDESGINIRDFSLVGSIDWPMMRVELSAKTSHWLAGLTDR